MNPCVLLVLCGIYSVDPDSIVRGIYINPYQANKKTYLENVFAKADSGHINAIVVDFKSDYGFLTYPSGIELAKQLDAVKKFIDVDYLIKGAALHNLKLIARIVCFRDNYLAQYKNCGITDNEGNVWHDKTDIAWTNPYIPEVTDYLISVVKEVVNLGIKSIAFDYIRFPTDGDIIKIKLLNVDGPRHAQIIKFLEKVKENVDAEIGVCIFGYAVWLDLKTEGQEVEKFSRVVDVIYPMLYPSHFHPHFKNDVNEYWRNYWIYFDSVKEAFKKSPLWVRVVPFIQGFDLYAENFSAEYITSQINGVLAADGDGYIIWNAGNDYSPSWLPLSVVHNSILNQSVQMSLNIRMREILHQYQDIDFAQALSLKKSQVKGRTTPQSCNLFDNLPLWKNRRFESPDQVLLW